MIKCMLFLRDKNTLERRKGLNVHSFGRVPIVGEYISLSSGGTVYKVTHVHHTGFSSNHAVELYVVEADDIQIVGGDPVPTFKETSMQHTALTLLILQLNKLVDRGNCDDITIEEVHQHIDEGTILEFLRQRGQGDIDLSVHLDTNACGDFRSFYIKQLQSIYDAYAGDEKKKWGVQNKGLCLLIAWTNEIIQQGSDWKPNMNISER